MLTLYSYPALFGVADNNGYGLKVFAFLTMADVPFRHEHVFDASKAPRSQLPYIVNGDDTVGDSEISLPTSAKKYRLTIDAALTPAQRYHEPFDHAHARRPLLGDVVLALEGQRYWHTFRDALLREHPTLTEDGLAKAQAFNSKRYYYQGIGRYHPDAAMGAWARRSRGACSISSPRGVMCMARNLPAPMPASMASSPISISTTSTRRSSNS